MKLTLTINASASALAKILAELPDEAAVVAPTMNLDEMFAGDGLSNPVMPELRDTADDDSDEGDTEATGETDSTGLPWDERIHASTKTQTAKGVWKKRKGVDDATMQAVENELRARGAMPVPLPVGIPVAPAPAPAPMPMTTQPAPMPVLPTLPQADPEPVVAAPAPMPMTVQAAPAPTPVLPPLPQADSEPVVATPTPAPAPTPDAAPESVDMMTLMSKIAAGQTAGTLDADYVNSLVKRVGEAFGQSINSVVDMMSKPDMLTYTAQLMRHDGKW